MTRRMLMESERRNGTAGAAPLMNRSREGQRNPSHNNDRKSHHNDPWRVDPRSSGNLGMGNVGWSHIPVPKTAARRLDIMSERVMHALLQVSMSVLAMVTHLDMINNDLYLKNILVNDIEPCTFQYVLGDSTWTIRTSLLFKVSDFGICSSPLVLNKAHDDNSAAE